MKKTIYLLRHGAIALPQEKIFLGRLELHLTQQGKKEIANTTQWLKRYITGSFPIFSSPLQRCIESATIIGKKFNQEITIEENLTEIALGKWEGVPIAKIKKYFPQEYKKRGNDFTNFHPPEGESFADVQKRTESAFRQICQYDSETIVIVAHAGVNRVILASILGLSLDRIFTFKQDYGAVNVIVYDNGKYWVKSINGYAIMEYG